VKPVLSQLVADPLAPDEHDVGPTGDQSPSDVAPDPTGAVHRDRHSVLPPGVTSPISS
jgi:hypothetical protein